MNEVKTFAGNATDKVRSTYRKVRDVMLACLALAARYVVVPMFCDTTMDAVFKSIIGVILDIARYMGIGITAYAVISWLLAMKDDNADGQSRAIRFVVVGIALVASKTLLATVLSAMGFTI